jgi:toxin ParE1/3/4
MTFVVYVRPRALAELQEIQGFLAEQSPAAADHVFAMIKHAILSLSEFPRRCALAREDPRSSVELRHLIVGNHRVLFYIVGDVVTVCRVVHAAQDLDPSDII